ncbi:MAG: hypothetical protein P8189_31295, partial [Anaerolineae bacterium]
MLEGEESEESPYHEQGTRARPSRGPDGSGDRTMIVPLLLLFAVLNGSPAYEATPTGAHQAAPAYAAPAALAGPAIAPSEVITYYAFLPLLANQPTGCAPIPGVQYSTLDVDGPPTDRPAEQHADLNLALRGYEVTNAYAGLVD